MKKANKNQQGHSKYPNKNANLSIQSPPKGMFSSNYPPSKLLIVLSTSVLATNFDQNETLQLKIQNSFLHSYTNIVIV